MSKIVQAVNSMIEKENKITSVKRVVDTDHDTTYFFTYNNKYLWAVRKDTDENYWLAYFPAGPAQAGEAMDECRRNWRQGEIDMVSYFSPELRTQEATESFAALHRIVEERLYGMNEVIDDILGDEFPF